MANNEARLHSSPPTPSPLLASPQSLLLPVHLVERKAMCTCCLRGCSLRSLGPPALPSPVSSPLCPPTPPSLCPLNLMAEFDASFLRCSGLGDRLPWPSSQPRLLFIVCSLALLLLSSHGGAPQGSAALCPHSLSSLSRAIPATPGLDIHPSGVIPTSTSILCL